MNKKEISPKEIVEMIEKGDTPKEEVVKIVSDQLITKYKRLLDILKDK